MTAPQWTPGMTAIVEFAASHGRTWRAQLRALWMSGRDEGPLRDARNTIGPSGLDRADVRSALARARGETA